MRGFSAPARYPEKDAVRALKTKTFSGKQSSFKWTDGPPILRAIGAVGSATGSRLAFQRKDDPGKRTRLLSVQFESRRLLIVFLTRFFVLSLWRSPIVFLLGSVRSALLCSAITFFGERINLMQIACIALILGGIAGLKALS